MNIFVICVLLSCTVSVTEVAAADCDTCTSDFNSATACGDIKTYISCLVGEYETDSGAPGCSDIKTKMDEAKQAYDDNSCATSDAVTDSCLCEVAFYQSAALDCAAYKPKLICLFAATGLGCDGSTVNTALVTSAKVAAKLLSSCLTDTCECEAVYHEADISTDTSKCGAIKAELVCLFAASNVSCDDSTTKIATVGSVKSNGKLISDCITDTCECEAIYHGADISTDSNKCGAYKAELVCLFAASNVSCDDSATKIATVGAVKSNGKLISGCITDTCECEAVYHGADISTDSNKCGAYKAELVCLFAASAVSCDDSTTKIATVGSVKSNGKLISGCITDTCECEAVYHEADISTDTNKCGAYKAELVCLFAASALSCDDSTTKIATVGSVKSNGKLISGCITDTCECEAAFSEIDTSAPAVMCTKLKAKIHCLVLANDMGCDGTSKRSAVATSTDASILDTVNNCRTDLSETCTCAINYAKTDTTLQAVKCRAATIAQTCLNNITLTTDNACDGSTLTATYLNATITPLVTAACSGTSLLLSVSVAAGYLLVLYEMFHY